MRWIIRKPRVFQLPNEVVFGGIHLIYRLDEQNLLAAVDRIETYRGRLKVTLRGYEYGIIVYISLRGHLEYGTHRDSDDRIVTVFVSLDHCVNWIRDGLKQNRFPPSTSTELEWEAKQSKGCYAKNSRQTEHTSKTR